MSEAEEMYQDFLIKNNTAVNLTGTGVLNIKNEKTIPQLMTDFAMSLLPTDEQINIRYPVGEARILDSEYKARRRGAKWTINQIKSKLK